MSILNDAKYSFYVLGSEMCMPILGNLVFTNPTPVVHLAEILKMPSITFTLAETSHKGKLQFMNKFLSI